MKILDVACNPIDACCCFELRGLEISCSTIAQPDEVMVFDGNVSIGRFDTVADAIKFVLFDATTT